MGMIYSFKSKGFHVHPESAVDVHVDGGLLGWAASAHVEGSPDSLLSTFEISLSAT